MFSDFRYIAYQVPTVVLQENGNPIYEIPPGDPKIAHIEKSLKCSGIKGAKITDLSKDSRARVIRFLAVLDQAHKLVNDSKIMKEEDRDTTLKIFMAPEFYFRPDSTIVDTNEPAYSFTEYRAIKDVLRSTILQDDKYNHWLVIPGTIMWRESEGDRKWSKEKKYVGGKDEHVYHNTSLFIKGKTELSSKAKETVQKEEKIVTKVIEKVVASKVDGLPTGRHSGPFDEDEKKKSTDEMWGLRYMSEKKRRKHVSICGGVWFGLEICREHIMGIVDRKTKKVRQGWGGLLSGLWNPLNKNQIAYPKKIELQLLTAGGQPIEKGSIATCVNGYIMRNDGYVSMQEYRPSLQTNLCEVISVDKNNVATLNPNPPGPIIKAGTEKKTFIEFRDACEEEVQEPYPINKNHPLYINPPEEQGRNSFFSQEIKIYNSKPLP